MKYLVSHFVLLSFLFSDTEAFSCTFLQTTLPQDHPTVATNYDWYVSEALLVTNKRNVHKTALKLNIGFPLQWVSRYGSVTFNQYGREFPAGGMNEAGLVVHGLWLEQTKPPRNWKPYVNEAQWIQYHLDRFATVTEALAHIDEIQYKPFQGNAHFALCDASGDCAFIQYLQEKIVIQHGDNLPYRVLTNSIYSTALDFLKLFEGFGGDRPIPTGYFSLDRFVRGAERLNHLKSQDELEPTLMHLAQPKDSEYETQWQFIYAIKNRNFSFKAPAWNHSLSVELKDFDFSCKAPVQMVEMNKQSEEFVTYDADINEGIVLRNTRAAYPKIPALIIRYLAAYPERTQCLF